MLAAALIIFVLVYAGMVLGSWPGLAIDRTGIALLGAIAFIWLQDIPVTDIANYIDLSAIVMLFSFMIISAQFYYSGFYTHLLERIQAWKLHPSQLLLVVIFVSGILSAVLLNDIICLAMTPLIIKLCFHKKLQPLPFLLGLAAASNIGSAITLVGNPQNLLIGEVLEIPFAQYLKYSLVPSLFGLFAIWYIIKIQVKDKWFKEPPKAHFDTIPFNSWQSRKGIVVVSLLLISFFLFDAHRDQIALIAAGFLLLSRRMATQTILGFIDWQLLVLFIGLFIVNKGFLNTHALDSLPVILSKYHIGLQTPFWLATIAAILSNIVSNVPAVMLLLPFVKGNFLGSLLALSSTYAGNLFLMGSIANLIVVGQAAAFGIKIDWKNHLKVGLPVTLISFVFLSIWLFLIKV